MVQNLAEINHSVQNIFHNLPPNFIKGPYESWLKFHPFASKGNEDTSQFMFKNDLFSTKD
jgi:hypothetical protein